MLAAVCTRRPSCGRDLQGNKVLDIMSMRAAIVCMKSGPFTKSPEADVRWGDPDSKRAHAGMMPAGGAGAAGPGAAAEAPAEEEKTEFDVKLTGFDAAAKIKVIKEVRAMTNLGLKEAKELVRLSPAPPQWIT